MTCDRLTPVISSAALILLLAACSSGGGTQGDVDSGSGDDTGTGDSSVLVGTFSVSLVAANETASIAGKVYDGAYPALTVWNITAQDGACMLLTPYTPFCSTSCGANACVADDTCQAYPTARSVGTITVTGLTSSSSGATTFALEPIGNTYSTANLAYPPFSEGDALEFAAEGDYFAAFSLTATGIAPLELSNNDTVEIEKNQPLTLTWTLPGQQDLATIHVKLDISHHGGIKGKIECDAPDTGSLTVPASLITQLINLGVAGYPSIEVTRSNTGSATISAGRIDLKIESTVARDVQVDGYTSCTTDGDCPSSATCNTTSQLCE